MTAAGSGVVYVAAGNDGLTQRLWSKYVNRVRFHIDTFLSYARVDSRPLELLGFWLTPADAEWQSACWCVPIPDGIDPDRVVALREALTACAERFGQLSVSWAACPATEVLGQTVPAAAVGAGGGV